MSEVLDLQPNAQLQRLSVAETQLAEIKNYKQLTIAGVEDRAGYKAVDEARKEVKKERVRIDKERKAINEDAQQFIKMVNGKAKEFTEILADVETALETKLSAVDNEKERIHLESERAEQERLQKRVALLISHGCAFDGLHYSIGELSMSTVEIKNALDAQFNTFADAVISESDRIKAAKAEQERLQREEAERLAAERAELEKLRAEQQERERAIRAEQDAREAAMQQEQQRIKREQEEKEALIRQEQEAIAAEKRAIEAAKQREVEEKERAEREAVRIEEEKRLAVEAERREQERLAAEEAARIVKEREEEARQHALRPDKEKLLAFSQSLDELQVPTCEAEPAQKIAADVKGLLAKIQQHIITKVKSL